mgnify:CR=1 FL=1
MMNNRGQIIQFPLEANYSLDKLGIRNSSQSFLLSLSNLGNGTLWWMVRGEAWGINTVLFEVAYLFLRYLHCWMRFLRVAAPKAVASSSYPIRSEREQHAFAFRFDWLFWLSVVIGQLGQIGQSNCLGIVFSFENRSITLFLRIFWVLNTSALFLSHNQMTIIVIVNISFTFFFLFFFVCLFVFSPG